MTAFFQEIEAAEHAAAARFAACDPDFIPDFGNEEPREIAETRREFAAEVTKALPSWSADHLDGHDALTLLRAAQNLVSTLNGRHPTDAESAVTAAFFHVAKTLEDRIVSSDEVDAATERFWETSDSKKTCVSTLIEGGCL